MGRGLSPLQHALLAALAPDGWAIPPSVGELAARIGRGDLAAGTDTYYVIYRALRGLERRGLVRGLAHRPDPTLWLRWDWPGF